MIGVLMLVMLAIPFWGVIAQPESMEDVVIYTFELDGGHVNGSFERVEILRRGQDYFNLPDPERLGYRFMGWAPDGAITLEEGVARRMFNPIWAPTGEIGISATSYGYYGDSVFENSGVLGDFASADIDLSVQGRLVDGTPIGGVFTAYPAGIQPLGTTIMLSAAADMADPVDSSSRLYFLGWEVEAYFHESGAIISGIVFEPFEPVTEFMTGVFASPPGVDVNGLMANVVVHALYGPAMGMATQSEVAGSGFLPIAPTGGGIIAPVPASTFTVNFDLDGGHCTVAGNVGTISLQTPQNMPLAASDIPQPFWPTANAFVFDGWVASGAALAIGDVITSDVDFIAQWRELFPVTFHMNQSAAGLADTSVTIFVPDNGTVGLGNIPQPPSIPTHSFVGWLQGGIGGTPISEAVLAAMPITGPSLQFTAAWSGANATVTFHVGSGLVGATMSEPLIGSWVVPDTRWTHTGPAGFVLTAAHLPTITTPAGSMWEFIGWQETDFGGNVIGNHSGLTPDVAGISIIGNVTFAAQFAIRITFDLGNGDPNIVLNMMEIHIYNSANALTPNANTIAQAAGLSVPAPTRANFAFTDWQQVTAAGAASGAALSSAAVAGMNITPGYWRFIAQWQYVGPPLEARFNLAGGTYTGTIGPILVPFAGGQQIPVASVPTNLVREHFTFQHWVIDSTGVPVTPSALAAAPDSNMVFTAVWQPNLPAGYVLASFNLDGGSAPAAFNVFGSQPFGLALPSGAPIPGGSFTPTKAGYFFVHWICAATGGIVDDPWAVNPTSSLGFTAVWTDVLSGGDPIARFHLAGGSASGAVAGLVQVPFTAGQQIPAGDVPQPTRTSHTFAGWYLLSGGSLAVASPSALTPPATGDLDFIARWTPNNVPTTRNVFFVLNGGVVGNTAFLYTIEVNVGAQIGVGNVPEPTRTGYDFAGWISSDGQTRTPAQIGIIAMQDADMFFVAQWTPQQGTTPTPSPSPSPPPSATIAITFNAAPGQMPTGGASVTWYRSRGTVYSSLPIPVRAGYTFTGWTINGVAVSLPHTFNVNTTLQATWTPVGTTPTPDPNRVTVWFNPGAGHIPSGVSNFIQGNRGFRAAVANFPVPVPPTGYTFIGWFLHGQQVISDFAAMEDVTLFAHFQRVQAGRIYTLTFNANHGNMPAGVTNPQSHAYGTVLTTLPVPTRAGFIFGGWRIDNVAVTTPFTIRGNVTMVAHWHTDAHVTPTPPPHIPAGHRVVVFDPRPGAFPAGEGGMRTGLPGFVINSIINPSRAGYIFVGWHENGVPVTFPLTVNRDMTIGALWTPIAGGTGGGGTGGGAGGGTAGAGSGNEPGNRPNPQTNPIAISFTIFGSVMIAGAAAIGISKLAKKQMAQAGQYRADMNRHNREAKLFDKFGKKR